MAYSDPTFTFNPVKEFGFDPSNKSIADNTYPTNVQENPYVPTCSDQSNQVKNVHHQQIMEYANLFGQTISYQPVIYNFNTHNFLYGEDPTSGYRYARKLKAIIDYSSYTTFLTKFGLMSDADITIYVPIREFERVWGPSKGAQFPLAGDLFLIDDSACDRPLGQSPMVFEITEKEDKIKPVDFMGGHYVWRLVAKRFDYSYQPNSPEERFLDDTSGDSKEFGRLEGGENPPDMSGTGYDIDDFAKKEFDNRESSNYGKYV